MTDIEQEQQELELEGLEKLQGEVGTELERVRFERAAAEEQVRRRSPAAMLQEMRELIEDCGQLRRCERRLERQRERIEGKIQFLTERPAIELERERMASGRAEATTNLGPPIQKLTRTCQKCGRIWVW